MKVLTIHGVPYNVNEKQEVFLYKSEICIGSYDAATQILQLKDNWQEVAQPFLLEHRAQVNATSVAAMQKARELQGVIQSE